MGKQTLEARLNYQKERTLEEIKSKGKYLHFSEELGFIYELNQTIYGAIMKIRLSLKSGRILVHDLQRQNI